MRIVFINQFFWPDSAATSQLLTDLVRFLAAEGHEVEVICGNSAYASVGEESQAPAAVVHRLPSFSFSRGGLARLTSYASFLVGALCKGLMVPRADLVVTLTTPPMLSVVGRVLRLLRHDRHFLWEMDLFPEALVDVGMMSNRAAVYRLLRAISNWSRCRADGVVVLGECMRERLLAAGVDRDRLHVADNWADGREVFPMRRTAEADEGYQLRILYSGNLGLAHEIETLQAAMQATDRSDKLRWRFVGNGARYKELADWCRGHGIGTVEFQPYCQRHEMARNLAWADVGLVTQKEACCGTVVPSKVYGLMAAGRPILYIGPAAATPARILERFDCGWRVNCGDTAGLLGLLGELRRDEFAVRAAGERARQAFMEHYDLPVGLARMSDILGVPVASARVEAMAASASR